MSETPRTDAQCDVSLDDARRWYDFARELERELTAAKARIAELAAGIRGALKCLQEDHDQYEHPEAAACDFLEAALEPQPKQDHA